MSKKLTDSSSEIEELGPIELTRTLLFNPSIQLPWLVLIHGLDSSRFTWETFIKENNDMFNIIAVDLRGHGESDFGAVEEAFRASTLVEDIRYTLTLCEVNCPFVLVGHRFLTIHFYTFFTYIH